MSVSGKCLTKLYTVGNAAAMLMVAIPGVVRAEDTPFVGTDGDGKLTFNPSPTLGSGYSTVNVETASSEQIYGAGGLSTANEQIYINIAMGIVILVLLLAFIRNCVLLAQGSDNKANLEKVKNNIAYNLLSIALVGGFWSCFWLFYGLF